MTHPALQLFKIWMQKPRYPVDRVFFGLGDRCFRSSTDIGMRGLLCLRHASKNASALLPARVYCYVPCSMGRPPLRIVTTDGTRFQFIFSRMLTGNTHLSAVSRSWIYWGVHPHRLMGHSAEFPGPWIARVCFGIMVMVTSCIEHVIMKLIGRFTI